MNATALVIVGGSTVGMANRAFGARGLSAFWYVLAASIGLIPMMLFAPKLRGVRSAAKSED